MITDGFLLKIADGIIRYGKFLSLVEFFKFVATRLAPQPVSDNDKKAYANIAIDIFIVIKWAWIILFWCCDVNNRFATGIVFYLILTNLHTYFYYHIWFDNGIITDLKNKRKFITLLLAFSFSNLCFAYLYALPFKNNFKWLDTINSDLTAFWFSISTSLTSSISGVEPLDNWANFLTTAQVCISFTFISIVLSKSIPQSIQNS
jgi:hypothetical protein